MCISRNVPGYQPDMRDYISAGTLGQALEAIEAAAGDFMDEYECDGFEVAADPFWLRLWERKANLPDASMLNFVAARAWDEDEHTICLCVTGMTEAEFALHAGEEA
jgi:hypothetical protein